jgi:hypothetical protein
MEPRGLGLEVAHGSRMMKTEDRLCRSFMELAGLEPATS